MMHLYLEVGQHGVLIGWHPRFHGKFGVYYWGIDGTKATEWNWVPFK